MSLLAEFTALAWVLLVVGSFFAGMAKTALPGISTISIAIFAAILPARASTAALLILFIIGDVFALLIYRRHANWQALIRLAPAVIAGLVIGALFLAIANDLWVKRAIGAILLLLIGFTMWQRFVSSQITSTGLLARIGYGSLAGFTTMVANAGGTVMSLYFLSVKFPVKTFLGTAAWFFAIVNITKLPIAIGIGLVTFDILILDAILIPGVVAGVFVGRWAASRMSQSTFDWAVIILTLLGAVYLLVS